MIKIIIQIFVVAAALAFVATPAEAKKLWLNVHLTAWHSESVYTKRLEQVTYQHPHGVIAVKPEVTAPYNKENFGLGVGYAFDDQFEARAGFYDNSHDQLTVYIGGAATTSTTRRLSVGIAGGFLLGGYEGQTEGGSVEYKEIVPFIQPIAQINFRRWRIEPGYVPKVFSDGSHIVTVSAGINF